MLKLLLIYPAKTDCRMRPAEREQALASIKMMKWPYQLPRQLLGPLWYYKQSES